MIYAGQGGEKSGLIPIHLPFLSLTQLRLNPPKQVDLTDKDQTPLSLLKKVDCAHDSIADSRAVMGADYNRLEHAYQALTNTTINLKDAESRIRDADMAKLMMDKIKNDILSQPQQSVIAQERNVPNSRFNCSTKPENRRTISCGFLMNSKKYRAIPPYPIFIDGERNIFVCC